MNLLRYLVANPYRHTYRSARRDGIARSWARHLWWRDTVAGLRNLPALLRERGSR